MYPDPQEIIPDYCQSHIFYHLQFILNGSAQREVRLTFHIMAQDEIFFLVSGIWRQKRMFTQDLELNIIWRHRRDIWQVETLFLSKMLLSLFTELELFKSITSTLYSVCIICGISGMSKIQAACCWSQFLHHILRPLKIIPQDDMFLFSQPFQTAATLLSWHFQGISYYSDVFIETYCLILYY